MKKFNRLEFTYRAWRNRLKDDRVEIKFILKKIPSDSISIDIGSHKGGLLYWILKAVGKKGQVYAFEPQPILFEYLSKFKSSFSQSNLTLINAGVSSESGALDLYVDLPEGKTSPGATFEKSLHKQGGHTQKIKVVQLDQYFVDRNGSISFIKIDVEGHELEVLKGASQIMTTDKPIFLIECEERHIGHEKMQKVFEYFDSLNYEGSFFWDKRLLPLYQFELEIHQATDDNKQIKNKKQYANNFIFQPKN